MGATPYTELSVAATPYSYAMISTSTFTGLMLLYSIPFPMVNAVMIADSGSTWTELSIGATVATELSVASTPYTELSL